MAITVGLWNFVGGVINTSINAYLTTQVGPGTDASHEAASAAVNVSLPAAVGSDASNIVNVQVFSGLSLGPGTYYLSLAPTTSIGIMWSVMFDADATVVLGSGVTLHRDRFDFTPDTYFPASDFPVTDNSARLWFSVTGDPVTPGGDVPEPATLWLITASCAGVAFRRALRV